MRRLRFVIGALLAVLWVVPLRAQQTTGTIRGRVVDDAQQPLARATVTAAGRGAVTGADGRYVITGVPAGAVTVRARMLGYAPATAPVTVVAGYPVVADLTMTAQDITLSEVVVTGYGEQTAGDITGAVTHLTPDEFNTGRITAPAQLLQSKVAGVQVVDNNEPGGGTSIRIRGATSVNASSDPLYVIDGMPLGNGAGGGLSAGRDPLNFLNPNDIESITVLKDASAAAIYGANAANGVVLITTKSGSAGRQGTQVEYSTSGSSSSVTKLPDVLNTAQFLAAVQAQAPSRAASLGTANTNWLNLISRTAYGQEQNVSLTGASQSMFYRLSLGYLNQDGIVRGTTTERLSLGANVDQHLFNDNLDIKLNLKGSRANDRFSGGALGQATGMAPTQPVYDPTDPTGFWDWHSTNAGTYNPMAQLALQTLQGTTWRSVGNMQAEYRFPFFQALKANINLGYDVAKADNQTFYPSNLASQMIQGHGQLTLTNNTQLTSLLEGYLNYAAPLPYVPGSIDLTAGYSYTQSHSEYPYFNETGLTSNILGVSGIGTAANVQNTLYVVDYKLISFFGRANYNLNDRYLASFSIRRDGSSRFGPGHQWGVFPAVSGAWRLSQESFLKSFAALSDLKLRASWATTGNQAIGDYLFVPTYTYGDALAQYYLGNQFVTTIRPSAVDQNIHWESTRSVDIGVDYGFLHQRFSGAIDWYTKKTTDMIFYVPVAAGSTFSNYVTTNVGAMQNQGIEASLSARILEGGRHGLGWTADFTVSHNANKLLYINPSRSVTLINVGGISGGVGNTVQVLMPGQPINSFYVYQQKYASGKPVYSTNPLDMYVDQPTVLDSVTCTGAGRVAAGCVGLYRGDGIINNSDLRPFHSPWPKLELGHTSFFTYHAFDLSFTLRAQLGAYVYNNVASANGSYQNITGSATPTNMDASVLKTGFMYPQYWSDYYVESASFLRMDNITVGYTLQVSGRPWRLYLTVQNAFTITGYSGVDPTAGLNGIDNNIYPRSRTFTGGLSVRF
jgi:iron complex outermembrane receptor protein